MNKYQLPESLITEAATLKSKGYTWPKIEEHFKKSGYRTKNGLPFHNANIAKQVLATPKYASLRQRKSKAMKRAEREARKAAKAYPLRGSFPMSLDTFSTEALVKELSNRGFTVNLASK